MIDICCGSKLWTKDNTDFVKKIMPKILKILNVTGEISILLTDDREMQKLNQTYRGKNHPTNVLSFETGDADMLGDIVLAFETLDRESKDQHKSFQFHLTHLLIHGVLHLLGFDHIQEDEAEIMEKKEEDLLTILKI